MLDLECGVESSACLGLGIQSLESGVQAVLARASDFVGFWLYKAERV